MSGAIIDLLQNILSLYVIIIFAMVIMSWLKVFGVVNTRNPIIGQIDYALHALTEPVLRPIRRLLPAMGGLDISPIILLFGIFFVQKLLYNFSVGQFL
jgi:YggT family protein